MLGAAGKVDNMIKECDKGLKKGSFVVKEWIKTNDDKDTKFLSYAYHTRTDTFSARPKLNWSPKKRGVRKHADCKSMAEVMNMVELFGLTKRSFASILMGTIHDPVSVFLPYLNNLKLIY